MAFGHVCDLLRISPLSVEHLLFFRKMTLDPKRVCLETTLESCREKRIDFQKMRPRMHHTDLVNINFMGYRVCVEYLFSLF